MYFKNDKREKETFFLACYSNSFGKRQLVTTMMMITSKKKLKEKKSICVCVHVCIFILRLIEEKKGKKNCGLLFNLTLKETSNSN